MDSVRLGVVGYGNMGTVHCKNVSEGKVPKMTLTAICDISEDRRKAASDAHKDVKIFDDAQQMFESGLCDLVIIAVPHYDHPRLAEAAFECGLNVITEKPAGVYTKQVMEMNDAAERSGKLFGIMYNQRTNPIYQKIRSMVKDGSLGHIKRISWTITDWYRPQSYHDSCTWRSTWKTEGGGALINQNPHQLDLWQWIFGMPDRISSHVSFGKYYNIEVEDDVTAFFEYDNGMTGTYITSTGEAPGTNRLEIACDMGKLVCENNKLTFYRNVVSEREFNKTFKGVFGSPECWKCEVPTYGKNEEHVGILKNVASALIKGTPLLAPGVEGIKGLTISNSIHLSAWTGKTVETKNFPHDEFLSLLNERIKNSKVVKKQTEQKTVDTEDTY